MTAVDIRVMVATMFITVFMAVVSLAIVGLLWWGYASVVPVTHDVEYDVPMVVY